MGVVEQTCSFIEVSAVDLFVVAPVFQHGAVSSRCITSSNQTHHFLVNLIKEPYSDYIIFD